MWVISICNNLHHPEKKLCTCWLPRSPLTLASISLRSLSMNFPILNISYKWRKWSFVTSLFNLTWVFSRLIHILHIPVILFCCQAILCYLNMSHLSGDGHVVVSTSWLLWIMVYDHSCINFCVDICFHFSWVYSSE